MDFEKTENGLSISVGASGSEYMNQSPVKCCIELNKKQFEVIVAAAKDCLEKNYSMVRFEEGVSAYGDFLYLL